MAHFNFVISQNAKWGHAGFTLIGTGKYSFTKKHCSQVLVNLFNNGEQSMNWNVES